VRIGFVCNEYPPGPHGGIGTFTQVLARGLAAAGHEVRVVGAYDPTHPAPDEETDRGVTVRRLRESSTRAGKLRARWKIYRHISRWVREGRVELVEAPDWQGWAAGWPRLPAPLVVRLNGSSSYFAREMGRQPNRASFWLERASLRRADFWCSVSEYTARRTKELFGLEDGPHAILYNPVEAEQAAPFEGRSRGDVVFSGTLTEKKGVISLVDAWPLVLARFPEARLHIYGKDGRAPDGREMRAFLADRLGAARTSVEFHGHVERERLFEALRRARAAVFPSYAEAFALAPLEAMVLGCPTVYSRRGSGPELLEDGREGLLVDPDDTAGLAGAIMRLLGDDQEARRIAEAGAQRVLERFSIEAMIRSNEEFFERCRARFRAGAYRR
jgi:glycosyltransferase involved in cell wall biosynthesis